MFFVVTVPVIIGMIMRKLWGNFIVNNMKIINKISIGLFCIVFIAIYIDDEIIGRSTSGNFSFNFKKNLVFGYIKNDISNDELKSKNLFIEVEKEKYLISIQLEPLKRTDFKNL